MYKITNNQIVDIVEKSIFNPNLTWDSILRAEEDETEHYMKFYNLLKEAIAVVGEKCTYMLIAKDLVPFFNKFKDMGLFKESMPLSLFPDFWGNFETIDVCVSDILQKGVFILGDEFNNTLPTQRGQVLY